MEFSPVDVTTAVFRKLRDIVLMDQFHNELQAVISVPAFFDEWQKEHIKSAAQRAGLKLLQLIDEPVAAALSSITIENGIVVVFGMDAGSYNVSIFDVSPDTKTSEVNLLTPLWVGICLMTYSTILLFDRYSNFIRLTLVEVDVL